jgi:hypothetical protein
MIPGESLRPVAGDFFTCSNVRTSIVSDGMASRCKLLPAKRAEGHADFEARAGGRAMKLPAAFSEMPGKTLFMAAGNRQAVLVTRTANKMRQRALNFPGAHAALDWCLNRRASFVLVPSAANPKLN